MLNYPRVAKPLGYEKKAITIIAEVKQLVQRLQSTVIKQRTIWESITLVVALDSLHDDFEMTTVPLLHSDDKDLEEIQQIVTSTEAAKLAKRAVGATTNLAMMAKKKQLEKYPAKPKTNKECFNCRKKGYYARDCYTSNKRKPEESLKKAKRARWKKNQAKAAAARPTTDHNNSNAKPYPAGRAFMTHTDKNQSGMWYLDSCASRHICNSQEKFADLRPKTYEFATAGGDIFRSEQVRTVILLLENGSQLTFCNVAYAPECDSNLISLGQLRETGISHHDHPKCIVLKQRGSIIGSATRRKNLFVLDTQLPPGKAMLVKRKGRLTYLLSKNPQIRLWHQRLGHASNARVIETFKLVDRIDIIIDNGQQEERFSSDSEDNNKDENLEPCLNNPPALTTTLLNKTINTSSIDLDDDVEQLCDHCIESKHTKIVRHKKMTLTTRKLQEIHADLWGPHNRLLLSGKIYVGLLLDEFTCKSWVLLLRSKDKFFDAFKLWLPRAKACGEKLGYL